MALGSRKKVGGRCLVSQIWGWRKNPCFFFVLHFVRGVQNGFMTQIYFEGEKETPACLPWDMLGSKGVGRCKYVVIFVRFPMSSLEQFCRKFALVFAGMSQNCRLQKTHQTNPRRLLFVEPVFPTKCWFPTSFIFSPTWGEDPFWFICFKRVETTNQSTFCWSVFFCTFSPTDMQ